MNAMRILVRFKVTPDYEALREADWAAGEGDCSDRSGAAEADARAGSGVASGVETRYVPRILDCFDESALEMALRMRDATASDGVPVDLGAISVGGREVEPHLKTLQALGYERATRVHVDAGLDFAPTVTASIIARYVQETNKTDLLMLGCRNGPDDAGTLPFLVAEELGWPCVTQVTEVMVLSDDRVRVAHMVDDGLLRVTVRLPCVLGVGNAVVARLRVPTLTARLARREAHIEHVQTSDLGIDVVSGLAGESYVLTGLEVVRRDRSGTIIGGQTPREKAQTLFDSHLKSLMGKL
ncbi:MAG: hypothetical protein KKA32_06415 [Actinobacteria bacterium]|nr:hypothetical protein [Actinomycetota bacterium]